MGVEMNKSSLASMPDLTDKVVLITGGEGGIGQGLVRVFATAGASVVIHYLSSSKVAEELAAELRSQGHSVATAGGDICSPEDCQRIVADCVAAFGKLDCLVNNAGVQPLQELESMTLAQWNQVVEINLNGTFNMTLAVARRWIASQQPGRVINIVATYAETGVAAPSLGELLGTDPNLISELVTLRAEDLGIGDVDIHLEIETKGPAHRTTVLEALAAQVGDVLPDASDARNR